MALDPAEILKDVSPQNVPLAQPPEVADYRPADVAGVCCAFCSKFSLTGMRAPDGPPEDEDADQDMPISIPKGICEQWEAHCDGTYVCDRFASGAPQYDHNGQEVWEFANKNQRVFSEIHFATPDDATREGDSNFVVKEILRTCELPVIPTRKGLVKRGLRIVRDGKSSAEDGIIALSELVDNFKAGAIPHPQIPLSDEESGRDDHKNMMRLNTGFVRDLWLVDKDGGTSLMAKMEITEPDALQKILNGTYADVSCGVPWEVISRGREFGTCLEHVALTNKPFIEGLGPFFTASDKNPEDIEVVHFAIVEPPTSTVRLSYEQLREKLSNDIRTQLRLPSHYIIRDVNISDRSAIIYSELADESWSVPINIADDGESATLAPVSDWEIIQKEEGSQTNAPVQENRAVPRRSSDDELEAAYRLREIRTSDETQSSERSDMAIVTQEQLDRLELSDDQRAVFQNLLDENAKSERIARESKIGERITQLEELGLKERPGALTLYREVMLSDDGGPATVLLSDSGQKERVGATELLDRFIDALEKDGKVILSEQALVSESGPRPPATGEGENEEDVDTRTRKAREALNGGRRRRYEKKEGGDN